MLDIPILEQNDMSAVDAARTSFGKNDTSQSKRITAQIAVQKWTEKVIECQRQIHQENITENAAFVENVTNRVR